MNRMLTDVGGFTNDETQRWLVHRGHALYFLRVLPAGSIDTFVTDPPYGIELALNTTGKRRSIAGDGRLEAQKLWKDWVPEAYRAARDNSLHLVFGTWKSPWMADVLSKHFAIKGCIVWDKRIIGLGHYLRPRWEMIYLCAKGRPERRGTAPADVWTHKRIIRTQHPCEKPVPLLVDCVRLCSAPRELVCDPFCGIGSSGVAALQEDRRFVGCEIDSRHAKLARLRLAAIGDARFSRAMRNAPQACWN